MLRAKHLFHPEVLSYDSGTPKETKEAVVEFIFFLQEFRAGWRMWGGVNWHR